MIEQLEQVSIRSREPILLTGPTGAGKSLLARRIFEMRKQRGQVSGRLVEVNCATLRGDNAMSTMFGHVKGAFTGAAQKRTGLLMEANKGILFLDEIGELGDDEQAMLLRAIEDKRFMPVGADQECSSEFQLIAGTNRNLYEQVSAGRFRDDLLARINLWTYQLPSLKERLEDLEPNLEYELERYAQKAGSMVSFNKAAHDKYMDFAYSSQASWKANFRDLNSSITRMGTLAPGGRITDEVVGEEIARLNQHWNQTNGSSDDPTAVLSAVMNEEKLDEIDHFDRFQLAGVIEICRESKTAAEAGRKLFNISRTQKTSVNDSHRLRQYLKKFDLTFDEIQRREAS